MKHVCPVCHTKKSRATYRRHMRNCKTFVSTR